MPSIWITSKSRPERSDAIHSFIRAADSATKRREAADFDSPAPAGAGTSPSGSRTDRANLRVATLINIWFMAHLPSQSSATAASQLGTGRSFPSKPRVRRGPAKSRIAGVITGAEPRVGHQVAPEGHGSRPPLPCGLVTGPSLPLFNHLVGTGEQRRRHVYPERLGGSTID